MDRVASRAEEKQRQRAEREARERAAEERTRRVLLLGAVVAAAAVIVGIAIAVSSGGGGKALATGPVSGEKATRKLFAGIPERGTELGRHNAPVTLVEYADLRCPVCREFTLGPFPALVDRYVRTGKLRIVFRAQTFVGQQYAPGDSERAARFAQAAGEQNRLWTFADLFYRNQGDETTTYVTDAFLRRLGRAVPGLDVADALGQRSSPAVDRQLSLAASTFAAAGFSGTPSFQIGRTGKTLRPLSAPSLSQSEFARPIDLLLRRG